MLNLLLSVVIAAAGFLYEDPAADSLIRQTMKATYNLDLAGARTSARALQARYPDHPAGYTLFAETYWWEAQTDPENESIKDTYYEAYETAVEKAEEALEQGKYPHIELTAYLASCHGSYARFKVTQEQAFFSALRAGLRAHGYAEEVYELDPAYYDIYVGTGAFNFFSGSLPAVIKPFAWLIGAKGDKELGIKHLQIAMERSRYSQTEGRIVYYTAMLEDEKYPEALRVLEILMKDNPDNFVLYTWLTDWYRRQGRNLEGSAHFERLFDAQSERSALMAKYALLEKAQLQDAHSRRADAIQTVNRLKAIPGGDALLTKKVAAFERRLRS